MTTGASGRPRYRGTSTETDAIGVQLDSFRIPRQVPRGLLWSSSTGQVLFEPESNRFNLWRRGDARFAFQVPVIDNYESGGFFLSRSGKRFAAVVEGIAQVWSVDPLDTIGRFQSPAAVLTAVAISNDDRRLAARDRRGHLHLWDLESKQLIVEASASAPPREALRAMGELLFSPDGRLLGDAWIETVGRVWDLTANPPTYRDFRGARQLPRAELSPDSQMLAVGDSVERIFEAATGGGFPAGRPSRLRADGCLPATRGRSDLRGK